jgi:hypothetical protein
LLQICSRYRYSSVAINFIWFELKFFQAKKADAQAKHMRKIFSPGNIYLYLTVEAG